MSQTRPRWVVLAFLAGSSFGFAQTTAASIQNPGKAEATVNLAAQSRDLLREMNDHGFSFQGMIVYDWTEALGTRNDSENGFGRYSFDLSMPVDGKKLFGLAGSDGLVRLKQHMRQFGATYDGAAQVYSNIDANSRTTLYEIWVEQRLLSDKIRLKAGKIDANTEFAAVQSTGDFLNSSMGYSPTIMAFPTYPEPKLGVNAFLQSKKNYGLGVGVFQTTGTGRMLIVEPGHTWNLGQTEHPGRVSFGYWRLDGRIGRLDGFQVSGTQGFYSVLEQSIWHQHVGAQGERKLSTFLQAGWAEGKVSPITHHAGGGTVLQGLFRKRRQDAIGAAATWIRFSSEPAAGFDLRSETAVETYYKASLTKHVALVQDFQYLYQPGGLLVNPNCWVITPRIVVAF